MDQHSGRSVVKADQAVPSVTASTLLCLYSPERTFTNKPFKRAPPRLTNHPLHTTNSHQGSIVCEAALCFL